jgi:two-component system NtrC family response regulator
VVDAVKHSRAREDQAVAVAVAFASQDETSRPTVAVPASGIDLQAVERALIVFALASSGGNRTRAARFLGLSRSALLYRMHKHGLATGAVTGAKR